MWEKIRAPNLMRSQKCASPPLKSSTNASPKTLPIELPKQKPPWKERGTWPTTTHSVGSRVSTHWHQSNSSLHWHRLMRPDFKISQMKTRNSFPHHLARCRLIIRLRWHIRISWGKDSSGISRHIHSKWVGWQIGTKIRMRKIRFITTKARSWKLNLMTLRKTIKSKIWSPKVRILKLMSTTRVLFSAKFQNNSVMQQPTTLTIVGSQCLASTPQSIKLPHQLKWSRHSKHRTVTKRPWKYWKIFIQK